MKFRFGRKRKQCKECYKTFYKTDKRYYIGPGKHSDVMEFDVCPYCGGDWIEV